MHFCANFVLVLRCIQSIGKEREGKGGRSPRPFPFKSATGCRACRVWSMQCNQTNTASHATGVGHGVALVQHCLLVVSINQLLVGKFDNLSLVFSTVSTRACFIQRSDQQQSTAFDAVVVAISGDDDAVSKTGNNSYSRKVYTQWQKSYSVERFRDLSLLCHRSRACHHKLNRRWNSCCRFI